MLRQNFQVEHLEICVKGDNFYWKTLAHYIKDHPRLSTITFLQFQLSSYHWKLISNAIISNPRIKTLQFNQCSLNPLSMNLIFLSGLDRGNLEHLSFYKNGLRERSCQALCTFITKSRTLKSLSLRQQNRQLPKVGNIIRACAQSDRLRSLDVSGTPLSHNCYASIIDYLKTTSNLTTLNLSRTSLATGIFVELAKILENNNSLKYLNISHNYLGDHTIDPLAEMLYFNSTLQSLNLDNCYLGFYDMRWFLRALEANTSLRTLSFRENNIPFNFLPLLGQVLSTKDAFKEIDLSQNFASRGETTRFFCSILDNFSLTHIALPSDEFHCHFPQELLSCYIQRNQRFKLFQNFLEDCCCLTAYYETQIIDQFYKFSPEEIDLLLDQPPKKVSTLLSKASQSLKTTILTPINDRALPAPKESHMHCSLTGSKILSFLKQRDLVNLLHVGSLKNSYLGRVF